MKSFQICFKMCALISSFQWAQNRRNRTSSSKVIHKKVYGGTISQGCVISLDLRSPSRSGTQRCTCLRRSIDSVAVSQITNGSRSSVYPPPLEDRLRCCQSGSLFFQLSLNQWLVNQWSSFHYPWISESVNQWVIFLSVNQWISEPFFYLWISESVNQAPKYLFYYFSESVNQWISESVNQWSESVNQWNAWIFVNQCESVEPMSLSATLTTAYWTLHARV